MSEHQITGINDDEGSIIVGQNYLVFPKFPLPCDYVRIVDRSTLNEVAYWVNDEWAGEPSDVMGAIIGALCEGLT